jgi:hypothetical protein
VIRLPPGPSHPNSLDVRIAPVKTIGFSLSIERASKYADSSSESVPCVSTTPSTSSRVRWATMR